MSTSLDYINHITAQISKVYNVRYRKMFGEYIIYINEKPLLLICDNIVYVKTKDELKDLMNNSTIGIPYKGAKEHYVLDIDDLELTENVLKVLDYITPVPKKSIKKAI